MRVRSQTVADDGFDKNVAEKMPKVKKYEEALSPPLQSETAPLEEPLEEVSPEMRAREEEKEKDVGVPFPQSKEQERPSDVSGLIEDLHHQLLTLGKVKRALELDRASDRKTIFQLAQDNKTLRGQLQDLNREIQRLREVQAETDYLKEENVDALEKIRNLQQELRSLKESLDSATRERDEALARITVLESQIQEKELLWIKGKLKEREVSHFAEENKELRTRLEEMLEENVDLERKYQEIKRSFHEIRESLTLLRDSCKTNLYAASGNPE